MKLLARLTLIGVTIFCLVTSAWAASYTPIYTAPLISVPQLVLNGTAGNANNYHQDPQRYAALTSYSGTTMTLTGAAPTGKTASMHAKFKQYDAVVDITHPSCVPSNTVINSGQGTTTLTLNNSVGTGCAAGDLIAAWQPHLFLGRLAINPDNSCGATADWRVIWYCNDMSGDGAGRNMAYATITCPTKIKCQSGETVSLTITNTNTLASSTCSWATDPSPTTQAINATAALNNPSCAALASTVSGNQVCANLFTTVPPTLNVACQEDYSGNGGYTVGATTSAAFAVVLAFNGNNYTVSANNSANTTISLASSFTSQNLTSSGVGNTAGNSSILVTSFLQAGSKAPVNGEQIIDLTNPSYITGGTTITGVSGCSGNPVSCTTLSISNPIVTTINAGDVLIGIPSAWSASNTVGFMTFWWGDTGSLPTSMQQNLLCLTDLGSTLCPRYADQATSPLPFYSSMPSVYFIQNGLPTLIPNLIVVDPTNTNSQASVIACLINAPSTPHSTCVNHVPCIASIHCFIGKQYNGAGATSPSILSDYDAGMFTDNLGNTFAFFQCDARGVMPGTGGNTQTSSCIAPIDTSPASTGVNLANVTVPMYGVETSAEMDAAWSNTFMNRISQISPGATNTLYNTGPSVPAVVHVTVNNGGLHDYYYMWGDNPLQVGSNVSAATTCNPLFSNGNTITGNCSLSTFGARSRGVEITQQTGPASQTGWFAYAPTASPPGAGGAIHTLDPKYTDWSWNPMWSDQSSNLVANYHSIFVDQNQRIIMFGLGAGMTQPLGYQGGPKFNESWGACTAPNDAAEVPYYQYGCFRAVPVVCAPTTEINCITNSTSSPYGAPIGPFDGHTMNTYSWPWVSQGYVTSFFDPNGGFWTQSIWRIVDPSNYLNPYNPASYSTPNQINDTFTVNTGGAGLVLGVVKPVIPPESWTFN